MPDTDSRFAGRNLTWRITQQLGVEIVAGEYSQGKAFPTEAELCERYGASRSVLREAVKMLTAKGLLSARPRQGTRVEPESNWNLVDSDVLGWLLERKFSADLIAEFLQVRRAVEPHAARLAAQDASDDDRARIREAFERMRAAEVGDDDPLLSDVAFHVSILQASGNRFFQQLESLVESALRYSIRLTNKYKGVALGSVDDHEAVLLAIENGDGQAAHDRLAELIDEAIVIVSDAKPAAR